MSSSPEASSEICDLSINRAWLDGLRTQCKDNLWIIAFVNLSLLPSVMTVTMIAGHNQY